MSKIKFILLLFIIIGCNKEPNHNGVYCDGGFPISPSNLTMLNSEYDDYNSDLEEGDYDMFSLIFSTNRNSLGQNFDLICYPIGISYTFEDEKLWFYVASGHDANFLYDDDLNLINTDFNEMGPHGVFGGTYKNLYFYSNDLSGNLDIKFIERSYNASPSSNPIDAKLLNSNKNDAYISISDTLIYFCSDRNGNFDIFKINKPDSTNYYEELTTENMSNLPIVDTVLSSISDDKCPFIYKNFIVFCSNREGGYGGYDLWYSKYENNSWTEPKNFGSNFNSAFDEYRPIVRHFEEIPNDLMIFSSNRDGGKGGFDLYYVGIDKLE